VVGQATTVVSFFACMAVAVLLHLSFVFASDDGIQSQIDYLPSLDLSTNQAKQQSSTLHIGTHILSESSKDNTQKINCHWYQSQRHFVWFQYHDCYLDG
jgi:hypothetical protein